MNWSDEWWIKLYTRDTTSWLMLTWQARAVLLFLLRKVNRAGELDLGEHGTRGLCAHLGMPWSDLEAPLAELIRDGCVTMPDTGPLAIPNFVAAQDAIMSNKARQAKWRDGHNAPLLEHNAASTERNAPLRNSNGARRGVTRRNVEIREKREIREISPECGRLWDLQNELRQQAIPGSLPLRATAKALDRVAKILADGHTPADCETVLRRYAVEARSKRESAQWFDGVTNWRPENFARALGKPPLAAGSSLPIANLEPSEYKLPARLADLTPAWARKGQS